MHRLQGFMNDPRQRWLKVEVDKVISSSPLQDINLITWFTFAVVVGLNAYTPRWYPFLYCCSINVAVVSLMRLALGARRPFEIDRTLKSKTNRSRQNYGFPSVESHMAVVVNGYIAMKFAEWWLSIPLFFLTLFIGFTRVYSCARFIHQVALSYFTGAIGLVVYKCFENKLESRLIYWQVHVIYAMFCVIVFVTLVSMAIEDNSTHFGSIPRSEYIRVVGGIFNTDPSEIHEHMHVQASKQLDNLTLFSDRGKQKYAERLYSRKDSFFHLQNNIAKKDMEKKQLRATYYGQVARERQREANRLSREEVWRKELEQDPNNDFLNVMMRTNYGLAR